MHVKEPHLPGVPRGSPSFMLTVSGTVKLLINGIPNPGLAVILPAIFKNVSIAAKEAIISV